MARGNPNRVQQIGLELYEELNPRIPRDEVNKHKKLVELEAYKVDKLLQVYVMGSYRRGSKDCGDIDIMITRKRTSQPELVKLWQRLLTVLRDGLVFLTHTLIESSTIDGLKWQGISRLPVPNSIHRRIDFLLVPWEQRGPALLYFTGNDLFTRSMRLLARKKGYTLNQRALMRGALRDRNATKIIDGENTGACTEEEIFQILGVLYRRPEERCIYRVTALALHEY